MCEMNAYPLLIINYQLSASVMGDQRRNPLVHCEKRAERGLSVRVARVSGSPRAYSPRDLKHGTVTMKGMKRLGFSHCHCEEDDRTTRQSIESRGMWTGLSVRVARVSG